jgi:lambda family phage portal protein
MKALQQTWFDRTLGTFAPQWHLRRTRARALSTVLLRHFEGAAVGRRTQGWSARSTDANAAASGVSLSRLRDVARDLVRNNPYAASAVQTIADHSVGWGISAKPAPDWWKRWSESTDCDTEGRLNFAGIQHLTMNAVPESGEVFIRRRWRRLADGYALPLQLQLLEADHLDTSKSGKTQSGGRIIQGVEFDVLGTLVAYWLFPTHPGDAVTSSTVSHRIAAADIAHVFLKKRPGQVRGYSWFAPVILRLKDFDDYEDATLMKQKVAACLSVVTSDPDGDSPALGTVDDTDNPGTDTLSPGGILHAPSGRSIDIVQPPSVSDHASYASVTLRAIATGLGLSYEDFSGDYSQVNFSSARMGRLRHQAHIESWRWHMLIPQLCDRVWDWANEAAELAGLQPAGDATWTPPPLPMIDPEREALAMLRRVRSGQVTFSDALRELGYDPDEFFEEAAADNAKLDAAGLTFDSDPRKMTQAGQAQGSALSGQAPAAAAEKDAE